MGETEPTLAELEADFEKHLASCCQISDKFVTALSDGISDQFVQIAKSICSKPAVDEITIRLGADGVNALIQDVRNCADKARDLGNILFKVSGLWEHKSGFQTPKTVPSIGRLSFRDAPADLEKRFGIAIHSLIADFAKAIESRGYPVQSRRPDADAFGCSEKTLNFEYILHHVEIPAATVHLWLQYKDAVSDARSAHDALKTIRDAQRDAQLRESAAAIWQSVPNS